MKIERLTKEQEALLPIVRDKWLEIGLSTGPLNPELGALAVEGVREAYAAAQLPPPRFIIWLDSPWAGAIGRAIAPKVVGEALRQVGAEMGVQMSGLVDRRVRSQMNPKVYADVGSDVDIKVNERAVAQVVELVDNNMIVLVEAEVGAEVDRQVLNRVGAQVNRQVFAQVGAPVSAYLGDRVDRQVFAQVSAPVNGLVGEHLAVQVGNQVVHQAVRLNGQVDRQVGDQVVRQVVRQVLNQVRVLVDAEVGARVDRQVLAQVNGLVDRRVDDQVDHQVGAQVDDLMNDHLLDLVGDYLGTQAVEQVDRQVLDQVAAQVNQQVGGRVLDQVNQQALAQARNQVGYPALGQAARQVERWVDDQVFDQVNGRVLNQLGAEVDMREWWKGRSSGQYGAGYLAWLDAHEQLGVTGLEPIHGQQKIAQAGVGFYWVYADFVILTPRSLTLHRDPQGQLHCEDGPAMEWADGWGVYAWHGTRVPASLVTGDGWTGDQTMAESNAEIRRCAIERMGWDKFLDQLGTEPVASAPDPANPGHELRLFDLPSTLAEMYDAPARLLICDNATVEADGTRRRFALPVPAHHTDPIAAAADLVGWSRKDYAALEVAL